MDKELIRASYLIIEEIIGKFAYLFLTEDESSFLKNKKGGSHSV